VAATSSADLFSHFMLRMSCEVMSLIRQHRQCASPSASNPVPRTNCISFPYPSVSAMILPSCDIYCRYALSPLKLGTCKHLRRNQEHANEWRREWRRKRWGPLLYAFSFEHGEQLCHCRFRLLVVCVSRHPRIYTLDGICNKLDLVSHFDGICRCPAHAAAVTRADYVSTTDMAIKAYSKISYIGQLAAAGTLEVYT
jgi:hypothetical protein